MNRTDLTLMTPAAEPRLTASLTPSGDDAAGVTPLPEPRTSAADCLPRAAHAGAVPSFPAPARNPAPDSPPRRQFTAEDYAERNRKRGILDAVHDYLVANREAKVAEACRHADVDHATYLRWRAAYKEHGEDGLLPGKSTGRKPKFQLPPAAQQKLVQFYVKTQSHALSLQLFRNDPLCPAELADWLDEAARGGRSRHQIPPALRQAMTVTPAVHDKFRGPKTYQLAAITTLRGDFEEMADGTRRTIEPGDWWVMDDMSVNFPFWFASPFSDSKLAQKHGVDLGRQTLCAMDVASGKWLGCELIGRPRDAYRAEDVLRFCRKLFTEYGLPRRGLRLERGVWKSKRITGYEVTDSGPAEREEDRPDMAEDDRQRVVGGLQALGIELQFTTSAKGKGEIETGFNFLQRVMEGTLS